MKARCGVVTIADGAIWGDASASRCCGGGGVMRMLELNGVGAQPVRILYCWGYTLCTWVTHCAHFILGLHTVHTLYWGYTRSTLHLGYTLCNTHWSYNTLWHFADNSDWDCCCSASLSCRIFTSIKTQTRLRWAFFFSGLIF